MKMKILILFIFLSFQSAKSQTLGVYCNEDYYYFNFYGYRCQIQLYEPIGFGNLSSVPAEHAEGKSDADVVTMNIYSYYKDLKAFPYFLCDQFKNIEIFDFYGYSTEIINEISFKNCKNLTFLNFNENTVSEISENAFIENSKLSELNFGRNDLKTLPLKLFASQIKLRKLNLYENQLEELKDGIFDSLINLLDLSIAGNKLTSLPDGIFQNLRNLLWLDMKNNQLTSLNSKLFENLVNLDRLYLSNNEISSISPNTFDNIINLQYLHLDYNQIVELPPNVFRSLKFLTNLILNNNNLTVIHSNSFNSHSKLNEFHYHNNSLNAFDERIIYNSELNKILGFPNPCIDRSVLIEDYSISKGFIKGNLQRCIENFIDFEVTTTENSLSTAENIEQCGVGSLDERVCTLERENDELRDENEILSNKINDFELKLKILEEKIVKLTPKSCGCRNKNFEL